ncbi:MAG: FAD:protein FMN transferase [Pseudomonadota bacterium]
MILRVFVAFILLGIAACERPPAEYRISGETMGTTYNVVVVDYDGNLDQSRLEQIITDTLDQVNAAYSNWDTNSEISQFNSNVTTEPIAVSDGLIEMVGLANALHDRTGGKFDLTLAPVIDLWGFGPSGTVTKRPDSDELLEAMESTGQQRVISVNPAASSITKTTPDASIDLSSIAKGYGIDAISTALREQGAESFLVEIGGDLFASGATSRGSDWRIGIEKPVVGVRALETAIEFTDLGMATSGDYRNYFEEAGVRFSHIIDPQTGRPITHETASVTVLAEDAMTADAWATALLALGADRGLDVANTEKLAVLFIVRSGDKNELTFNTVSNTLFDQYQANLGN